MFVIDDILIAFFNAMVRISLFITSIFATVVNAYVWLIKVQINIYNNLIEDYVNYLDSFKDKSYKPIEAEEKLN